MAGVGFGMGSPVCRSLVGLALGFLDGNVAWPMPLPVAPPSRFGDDVDHEGKRLNWGTWAIANSDPDYRGTGGRDSGDDYGAAPGQLAGVWLGAGGGQERRNNSWRAVRDGR